MNEQELQTDITVAEELDENLQEQSVRVDDIQGSLEAIAQAIVVDEEPIQLNDHQQLLVDDFKAGKKEHKGRELAVADSEAIEAYVDNRGKLHMDGDAPFVPVKPLDAAVASAKKGDDPAMLAREYGANVFGAIEFGGILLPGNEGFFEVTSKLARKAALSFADDIPLQFKLTAKALNHYVGMAQKLRQRLLSLRPMLEKRDFPYEDVFEYAAYSRFFQVGGKAIGGFSAFKEVMDVQSVATRHVMQAGGAYSVSVMEKLLATLQDLQAPMKPDVEKMVEMRDSIANLWMQSWEEAEISLTPGQTPQVALNAFPDRKFVCLASLLDNRYLVAHQPKNNGGKDPVKITSAVKHYGASLVFDKNASDEKQASMNVPNIDDLLALVDQTINVLHDMKGFELLAKKNDSFAKDFKKAADILNKRLASENNPAFFGFIAEYFKLATAVGQALQQPHVQMAWMYVRCAMVVTALAELAAVEESKQRIAAARFLTKQNTEFVNPALESFNFTNRVLRAAKLASTV